MINCKKILSSVDNQITIINCQINLHNKVYIRHRLLLSLGKTNLEIYKMPINFFSSFHLQNLLSISLIFMTKTTKEEGIKQT